MTKSNTRARRDDTLLLVIDVQERLTPAMNPARLESLSENLVRLGAASAVLGFDVALTEQYPKGLGPTLTPIREAFAGAPVFEKTCFSAVGDDAVSAHLREKAPRAVLVAGMETHICVFQSVRALIGQGYETHVLKDAVASRADANYETGLGLMHELGAVMTSTETVLFDMLGGAGTDEFKAISKLVR